jgi:hypothetical protein
MPMIVTLRTVVLISILAACGDNRRTLDASVPGAPVRAVAVAGDFVMGHPGVLSTLDPATLAVTMNTGPAMAVGNDPILRHIGRELFIINRAAGNNVTILDDQTLALSEQLGTGANTNPQDVAVVGTRLYVPTFGNIGVTVLTRGSTATTTIDLSADDPDGKPNCISAYLVGTDVYVVCELLDDTMQFLPPRGPGKVYVIDTATDHVRATLALHNVNPFGVLEQIPAGAPHAQELVIPTVSFADGSGCIERIIPGPVPAVPDCLVDNATLGGYASRLSFQVDSAGSLLWAAVPSSDFLHSDLRGYDLGTDMRQATPINPSTQVIGDVAVCPSGQLVVADTTKNANGLRVYEGTIEKTASALPIGLPPTSTRGLVCY